MAEGRKLSAKLALYFHGVEGFENPFELIAAFRKDKAQQNRWSTGDEEALASNIMVGAGLIETAIRQAQDAFEAGNLAKALELIDEARGHNRTLMLDAMYLQDCATLCGHETVGDGDITYDIRHRGLPKHVNPFVLLPLLLRKAEMEWDEARSMGAR